MKQTMNGALMITGTCVGAGMLALPIAGCEVGFLPCLTVMVLAWAFMSATGLLYAEVSMWFMQGAHLSQMTQSLLGKRGRKLSWLIYLFIAYASLVAYQVEGGKVLLGSFDLQTPFLTQKHSEVILFAVMFAAILALGVVFVNRINSALVVVMVGLYLLILLAALPYLEVRLIGRQNWDLQKMARLLPLMLTAFSFPGIVPALATTMGRDFTKMKHAIMMGTTGALVVYATWILAVMGCVDIDGPHGLRAALINDRSASGPLMHLLDNPMLMLTAQAFAFIAIATSFLGISWGLMHFLADALQLSIAGKRKFQLIGLVAVPALGLALLFDKVFFKALEMSGGLGDAMISGIIPALLVWVGVHRLGYSSQSMVTKRAVLGSVILVASCVLTLEISHLFL